MPSVTTGNDTTGRAWMASARPWIILLLVRDWIAFCCSISFWSHFSKMRTSSVMRESSWCKTLSPFFLFFMTCEYLLLLCFSELTIFFVKALLIFLLLCLSVYAVTNLQAVCTFVESVTKWLWTALYTSQADIYLFPFLFTGLPAFSNEMPLNCSIPCSQGHLFKRTSSALLVLFPCNLHIVCN